MRENLHLIKALALTSFSILSQAYLIDQSCANAGNGAENFVKQGMDGGFNLAQVGMNGLNNPSAAQTNLVTWSFGSFNVGAQYIRQTFNGAMGANAGVLSMRNQAQGNIGPGDVKVYCDQSRLQLRPRDGKYFDPDVGKAVDLTEAIFDCKYNLMFTLPGDATTIDQIQVCPWFLQWAAKERYPTVYDLVVNHQGLIAKLAEHAIPWAIGKWYTPMDLVSLFDKVFLHELTHTRAGGKTKDEGGWGGYGWKNCLGIANGRGTTNADTYALYGSASYILSQSGRTVNQDGTFT